MQCPDCEAEMEHHDTFGKFARGVMYQKAGDIYCCPNSEGFGDADELQRYRKVHPELDSVKDEAIVCGSAVNNGTFYTYDGSENLHEGYPC